jgi:hypothetical protein
MAIELASGKLGRSAHPASDQPATAQGKTSTIPQPAGQSARSLNPFASTGAD